MGGMNRRIELIPAPHERGYSKRVAQYLLKMNCRLLCLEFPRDVERYLRKYSRGEKSYEGLKRILIKGEVISPPFEKGYRPLLRVLPKLNKQVGELGVHCFEDLNDFNDWVLIRDEFILQLLSAENYHDLASSYEELVEETKSRNEGIAWRIRKIMQTSKFDVYVVIGRLHGPLLRDELNRWFRVEEIVLEDACLTPLDESIILSARGRRVDVADCLKRHRQFAKEASEKGKEILELLRSRSAEKKYNLKRYGFF